MMKQKNCYIKYLKTKPKYREYANILNNAGGHYLGLNALADYMEVSKSQMPMNIRGDMWGNFNGKYYEKDLGITIRGMRAAKDALCSRPMPD